jgi:hypothetical protein
MTTRRTVIDHPAQRLVVALPRPYDAAREHYEALVPEADSDRFFQTASWQASLELAEINAPHGFMRYYRADITAVMAGPSCTPTPTVTPNWPSTSPRLLFASYGDPRISEVGKELNALLAQLITLLGGDPPAHLSVI